MANTDISSLESAAWSDKLVPLLPLFIDNTLAPLNYLQGDKVEPRV